MNKGFFDALSLLGSENNVDTDKIVEKVKSALIKAIKKAYPDCEDNFRVDIDPVRKKFDMFLIKTVVDDEPIDYNEINIDEARTIDPAAYVGGTVDYPLDAAKFGRAAAQSAKQSIKGDLREINRENILNQFQDRKTNALQQQFHRLNREAELLLLFMTRQSFIFSEMNRFRESISRKATR